MTKQQKEWIEAQVAAWTKQDPESANANANAWRIFLKGVVINLR